MSGVIEFKDQKPYAVEGLLIYLYTVDYPKNSSSEYFLQPQTGMTFRSEVNATTTGDNQVTKKTEAMSRETRLKIRRKSQRPEYPWQECIALCRIGEYCGARRLRDMAAVKITWVAATVLKSSDAMQFFADLWKLPHPQCQEMVSDVIRTAAQNVKKLTESPLFEDSIATHPSVACDLIKVLGMSWR